MKKTVAPAKASKLTVYQTPDEKPEAAMAKSALRPDVQAALTAYALVTGDIPDVELDALVAELTQQARTATGGSLARLEAMMTTQAHTLDLLFNRLTRRSLANMGDHTQTAELYMKLALRAQSQCRATAEALHEMKYPKPVSFVQQANIAHGPQQVNNGSGGSRAGENGKQPNELLEQGHGERLDEATTGTAAAADIPVEAVGAIHRA